MALLMFDGFEAYPRTNAPALPAGSPWKSIASTFYPAGGRTGARGISSTNEGGGRSITKDLDDPATLYVGAGAYWMSTSAPVIKLRGDVSGNICDVYVDNATGEYALRKGDASELFRAPLGKDVWHYFEVGVTVNGATSSIELRLNGATVYSNGSVDLAVGSNTGVRDVMFIDSNNSWASSSTGIWVDDVYLCDDTGAEQNTFLGPVRVFPLSPDADAAVAWTPNAGATNYTQVDEGVSVHDGDSTYVASSTVGDKDIYGLADLAAEYQNPVAVQAFWAARHDDSSGGAGVAAILKSGVTEVEGTEQALSAGYLRYVEPQQVTDPDTGAAWTPAGVNALQVGAIVKSNL